MGKLRISDAVAGLAFIGLVRAFLKSRKKISKGRLPPGPKGLPFVGNILDLPNGKEALHWAKHHSVYGQFFGILAYSLYTICRTKHTA